MKRIAEQENMKTDIKRVFRPEFLGRVKLVIFNKMTEENASEVFNLEVKKLNRRIESSGVSIEVSEGVKKHILKSSFDESLGARNIRVQIETLIEDKLVNEFISDNFKKGAVFLFEMSESNEITYKIK